MAVRVPPSDCWSCGRHLDGAAVEDQPGRMPVPGDMSLCIHCGAVAVFGEGLVLEKPTAEQFAEMAADPEFQQYMKRVQWTLAFFGPAGALRWVGDTDG